MRAVRIFPAVAIAMCGLLTGCNSGLLTTSVVLDVDSSQNTNPTGIFSTAGAWDLQYQWDCSRQRSEGLPQANGVSMLVNNADDDSGASEHSRVARKGTKGKARLDFKRGGSFYVKVDSICDWHLIVDDLGGK